MEPQPQPRVPLTYIHLCWDIIRPQRPCRAARPPLGRRRHLVLTRLAGLALEELGDALQLTEGVHGQRVTARLGGEVRVVAQPGAESGHVPGQLPRARRAGERGTVTEAGWTSRGRGRSGIEQ